MRHEGRTEFYVLFGLSHSTIGCVILLANDKLQLIGHSLFLCEFHYRCPAGIDILSWLPITNLV